MKPKYDVEVRPTEGRAFSILDSVCKGLKHAGASPAEISEYHATATDGDYDHLLRVSMEWVDLVA